MKNIGLFRVKAYLEKLLSEKYSENLIPTLKTLEDICKKTEFGKIDLFIYFNFD